MKIEIKEDWKGEYVYTFETLPNGEWKVYRVHKNGGGQAVALQHVPRYVLEWFVERVMERGAEDC